MTTPKAHWSEKEQQYWIRDLNGGVLWFDSVLDAQAAARQIEIDNAVKAEREAIVEWLRRSADPIIANWVSAQVENKEYRK